MNRYLTRDHILTHLLQVLPDPQCIVGVDTHREDNPEFLGITWKGQSFVIDRSGHVYAAIEGKQTQTLTAELLDALLRHTYEDVIHGKVLVESTRLQEQRLKAARGQSSTTAET